MKQDSSSVWGAMYAVVASAMMMFSTESRAVDSELDSLLKCKALQDDAARLACYDGLDDAVPVVPEATPQSSPAPAIVPSTSRTPVVTPSPASAPKPALSDDIGREKLRSKDSDHPVVSGQVIKCRKDIRNKYVFSFANGQVWRQKGNKIIRWKDCDFEVTIRKDFFGYIMQPVGDDKNVRIARVK